MCSPAPSTTSCLRHMFRLTLDGLARAGTPVKGAKIALLGWAFLSNSDDTRNTPSEPYRDALIAEGADGGSPRPVRGACPGCYPDSLS